MTTVAKKSPNVQLDNFFSHESHVLFMMPVRAQENSFSEMISSNEDPVIEIMQIMQLQVRAN